VIKLHFEKCGKMAELKQFHYMTKWLVAASSNTVNRVECVLPGCRGGPGNESCDQPGLGHVLGHSTMDSG
jgi:hypothetical protein